MRSPYTTTKSSPPLATTRESVQQQRPNADKKKKKTRPECSPIFLLKSSELDFCHLQLKRLLPIVLAWAAKTKYHRLCGLNNRHLFLTVLEAGRPRSKCRLIYFLVRALPGLQMAAFSLCPHMAFSWGVQVERERSKLSGVS